MGIRGEIFSEKVILPNRTYFFNVKENRMGAQACTRSVWMKYARRRGAE